MNSYLDGRSVIGKVAAACMLLASPAYAFDLHPPLRDDGARWAAAHTPTAWPRPVEHQGFEAVALGQFSEAGPLHQIGLAGHVLRLSAITLAPGGQIAADGPGSRPGILVVTGGEWTEGVPGSERVHTASGFAVIPTGSPGLWFFNRGDVPATALAIYISSGSDAEASP